MLKYHTIDISCRVIPQEVSLLFNITGCTIKCPGCNEKTLWKDKGTLLTFNEVRSILDNYNNAVTCVCFMGGEHAANEINDLARFVKLNFPCLHTAWYSGLDKIAPEIDYCNFNYIKTGSYQAAKGALGSADTNQRVFLVSEDCELIDITEKYIRTEPEVEEKPVEIEENNNTVEAEINNTIEELEEVKEIEEIEEVEEIAYKVQEETEKDEDTESTGIFMEI